MMSEGEALASSPPELAALLSAQGEPEYEAVIARSYGDPVRERALCGDLPGLDPGFRLTLPVDWTADPYDNRSWRYRLHTFEFADVLCQIYRDDGDQRALRTACAIALDWVRSNPRNRSGISEFAWYDMAVGIRAAYFSFLLRAGSSAGVLSDEDAADLFHSVLEHADFLVDDDNYAHGHNHGLFQDEGLLLVAGYLRFLPEAEDWRARARGRALDTLRSTIDFEEGVHLEHSSAYQYAIVNMLHRLIRRDEALRRELDALVRRMELSTGWFVTPDNQVPPIGDSSVRPAPNWARQAAEKAVGLRGFLRTGFGVVREAGCYLVFISGHHSSAHKHEDELSFVLQEDDVNLITDSGYFAYDEADPRRRYDRSAFAHNGLVVDRQVRLWAGAAPYGSGLEAVGAGDGWYGLQGRNPLLAPLGIEHRRLLIYRPKLALIIVDELEAEAQHSYTRLIHLGPDLSCAPKARGADFTGPDTVGSVRDWSDVPVEVRLIRGRSEPDVQGWFYPRPREEVEVDVLELEAVAASTSLVSIVAIGDREIRLGGLERRGDRRIVGLHSGGEAFSLTVSRSGTDLEVAAQRSPETGAELEAELD